MVCYGHGINRPWGGVGEGTLPLGLQGLWHSCQSRRLTTQRVGGLVWTSGNTADCSNSHYIRAASEQLASASLLYFSVCTNTNHWIHSETHNFILSCPPRAHAHALPRAHSTTRRDITCTPRRKAQLANMMKLSKPVNKQHTQVVTT